MELSQNCSQRSELEPSENKQLICINNSNEQNDWCGIQNDIDGRFIDMSKNLPQRELYDEEDRNKYRKLQLVYSNRLVGSSMEGSLVKKTGQFKQSWKGLLGESLFNRETHFVNNVDIRMNKFTMSMMDYLDKSHRMQGKTPLTTNMIMAK